MAELLLGILVVVNLGALAGAGWLLVYGPSYRYEPTQTARLLAARWLDLTDGEYTEQQARDFIRREYLTIAATFGLPLAAGEAVIDAAWGILKRAPRAQPATVDGAGLYA